MAKLAIMAGLLVALLAIADATTVTTTVIEDNPSRRQGGQMQQCREELRGMQFNQCEMYLRMGQQGSRRGGRRDAVEENPSQQEQYMWGCCEEIKNNVMPMCRCEAIEEALMMAEKGSQSYGGQGMEEMMRMAMNLPKMCKWTQPTMCEMMRDLLL